MMKRFFFAIVLFSLSAAAEPTPSGTILATDCGKNTGLPGEENRFITRVCLAVVQGLKISLVVVESEDSQGAPLPTQYLPIVVRAPAPQPAAGGRSELLLLGTNQAKEVDKYTLYVSRRATLVYARHDSGSGTPIWLPKSISGRDLSGVKFSVDNLKFVIYPPVPGGMNE